MREQLSYGCGGGDCPRHQCQFSEDLILTDTAEFQVFGLVDVFAPEMVGEGEGQVPSGTKVPITVDGSGVP